MVAAGENGIEERIPHARLVEAGRRVGTAAASGCRRVVLAVSHLGSRLRARPVHSGPWGLSTSRGDLFLVRPAGPDKESRLFLDELLSAHLRTVRLGLDLDGGREWFAHLDYVLSLWEQGRGYAVQGARGQLPASARHALGGGSDATPEPIVHAATYDEGDPGEVVAAAFACQFCLGRARHVLAAVRSGDAIAICGECGGETTVRLREDQIVHLASQSLEDVEVSFSW